MVSHVDRQAVLGTVEAAQIWKSVLAGEYTSATHDYTTEKHGNRIANRENVLGRNFKSERVASIEWRSDFRR